MPPDLQHSPAHVGVGHAREERSAPQRWTATDAADALARWVRRRRGRPTRGADYLMTLNDPVLSAGLPPMSELRRIFPSWADALDAATAATRRRYGTPVSDRGMSRSDWIAAHTDTVAELAAADRTLEAIAQQLAAPAGWVLAAARAAGVAPPRKAASASSRNAWTDQNAVLVAEHFAKGRTVAAVMDALQAPRGWVVAAARKAGVLVFNDDTVVVPQTDTEPSAPEYGPSRPPHRDEWAEAFAPLVAEHVGAGRTVDQIAGALRVREEWVRLAAAWADVAVPRRRGHKTAWIDANAGTVAELAPTHTSREIAEHLSVPYDWVRDAAAAAGITTRQAAVLIPGSRRHWIANHIERVAELAAAGKDVHQIADTCGVDTAWVGALAREHGITIQPKRRNPDRDDAVIALWESQPTLTLDDVAQRYGLTRERIRQILSRAGAQPHQHGRYDDVIAALAVEYASRIRALAAITGSQAEIAYQLGLRVRDVREVMRREGIRCVKVHKPNPERFTLDEAISALRAAATANHDGALTGDRYEEWRKQQAGRHPSAVTIALRFGWREAKRAAGVDTANPSPGVVWEPQLVVEAVRQFIEDTGRDDGFSYDEWRSPQRFVGPSSFRIRGAVGAWTTAVRMARAWQHILDTGTMTTADIATSGEALSVAEITRRRAQAAVKHFLANHSGDATLEAATGVLGERVVALIVHAYGDWQTAIDAVRPQPHPDAKPKWTDEQIDDALRQFAASEVAHYSAWVIDRPVPSAATVRRRRGRDALTNPNALA